MERDPLTPEDRELWNKVADLLGNELAVQVAIGRTDAREGAHSTSRIILNEL